MFETIKKLFLLVEKRFYKKFLFIQLLIIISGTIEIVSFFSILPFISLIANPGILDSGIGFSLYQFSGLETTESFIFTTGIIIIVALIFSSLASIFRAWYTTKFANEVGFGIGDNLFLHYLKQDYEFHIFNNSSSLTKQITVEANRVKNIMKSLLQLNSNIFMALFIVLGMTIYNFKSTSIIMLLVACIYFLLHLMFGKWLLRNGSDISKTSKERFKIISNSFGGISEIITSDCSDYFGLKMKNTGKILTHATTVNQIIAQVPGKIFLAIFLSFLVSLILYYSNSYENIKPLIITLTAFIMAGYKLIPLFQSIYESLAKIKSNSPAIESVLSDFPIDSDYIVKTNDYKNSIKISGDVTLNDVSYTYHGQSKPTLNNINIFFPKGKKIGIVGKSGSGKTTLIKLLISLIYPSKGELRIGENLVDKSNAHLWKMNLAIISQDIFLMDGTISENISFGQNEKDVDFYKINECIKKANLDDHIKSLPNGINTEVGERGIQLSGGQKQRIGIARAIYNDAEFLIMDEATSALDKITEQKIIEDIVSINSKITIIMIAHRTNTLRDFDKIYIMDQGEVTEHGSYKDLITNSDFFKKMSDIK